MIQRSIKRLSLRAFVVGGELIAPTAEGRAARTLVKKGDVCGAIVIFWLVFLSTIPAVVPFLVFRDRFVALGVSNLLLLTMLFLVGYLWARATHSNPWIVGSILLLVGLVMVAIAMALGG